MAKKASVAVLDVDSTLNKREMPFSVYGPLVRRLGFFFRWALLVGIEDDEATRFTNKGRIRKSVVIHIPAVILSVGNVLAFSGINVFGPNKMYDYFVAQGYTRWDVNSLLILYVPQTFAPIAHFVSFGGMAEKLNEFNERAKAMFQPTPERQRRLVNRITYKVGVFFVMTQIFSISLAFWNYMTFRDFLDKPTVLWFLTGGKFLQGTYQLMCPIAAASTAFLLYTAGYIAEGLIELRSRIIQQRTQKLPTDALNSLLDGSRTAYSLVSMANNFLGSLVCTLYAVHLLVICCGLYFGTAIFDGGQSIASWPPNSLTSFGIANIIMSATSGFMLFSVQSAGQRLCSLQAAVKKELEELEMVACDDLSSTQRCSLRILQKRFCPMTRCPLRPLDTFNVNSASGASVFGLILTYLIVLLQFKIQERAMAST